MKSRQLALLIFSLMIIPNVGCQGWYRVRDTFYFCEPIDEAIHSYNCHCAAKRAWKARFDRYCERESVDHFGAGFRAGYADVAMGKPGCVPPLPPRRYWGWRYQNCEGQQCVAGWFDGYPAGARAAEEDGAGSWSRMQTSYLIDAQYAARMPGAKRGGPVPPGAMFPGEELEEVPASQTTLPPTSVNTPLQGVPETEVTPVETPAAPVGPSDSDVESTEEVGVFRKLESTPAKIVKAPIVVKEVAPTPLVEEQPAKAEETAAPIVDAPIRRLDMPAVELLSGVSVPKKQEVKIESAPVMQVEETTAPEFAETSSEKISSEAVVEQVAEPAIKEVVEPVLKRLEVPTAGIVAETPAYSLGDESKSRTEPAPVISGQVKRKLPPIIPSKSKKQLAPIVQPVEERGRFTQLATPSLNKQVAFESQDSEESFGLRRIGKSK